MRFTKLFNSRLGYIYKSKQRIVVTRYGDVIIARLGRWLNDSDHSDSILAIRLK